MKLNPDFFKTIYSEMLNAKKTTKNVPAAADSKPRSPFFVQKL